jgi:hypothetical protein
MLFQFVGACSHPDGIGLWWQMASSVLTAKGEVKPSTDRGCLDFRCQGTEQESDTMRRAPSRYRGIYFVLSNLHSPFLLCLRASLRVRLRPSNVDSSLPPRLSPSYAAAGRYSSSNTCFRNISSCKSAPRWYIQQTTYCVPKRRP